MHARAFGAHHRLHAAFVGAEHILVTAGDGWQQALKAKIAELKITVAFDAIAGPPAHPPARPSASSRSSARVVPLSAVPLSAVPLSRPPARPPAPGPRIAFPSLRARSAKGCCYAHERGDGMATWCCLSHRPRFHGRATARRLAERHAGPVARIEGWVG
jgi:hypothetical protein